jgi:IS5 family transposase
MMKADELLANAPGKAFIADAGYDSNRFRQAIRDKKKRAVIGSKPERPRKLPKSAVPQALSRRVLLPQLEALPRHRHALREDRAELPRAHPSGLCVALAGAELGTPPSRPECKHGCARLGR